MQEFNTPSSAQPEELDTPVARPTPSPGIKHYLLEKKYFAGLSAPWIAGIIIVLAGAFWYITSSGSSPGQDVNSAAGFDDDMTQAQPATPQPVRTMSAAPDGDESQLKNDVAHMVNGVRDYAQANRQAIQRLSETVKAQQQQIQQLQREGQQISQYQSEVEMLKSRLATLETERVNGTPSGSSKTQRSLISGMHLNSIQEGAAWIFWNGSTWSVREGDTLAKGKVSIIRIDAENRQVFTSAGIVR